ncbi:MAG: hypothetical protein RSD88_08355 [Anaerovoracaceae bacterium]
MEQPFKTHKNNLLLIAGLVWGIAGFNILRIGLIAYQDQVLWQNILISIGVFLAFQLFVFRKMVKKHTLRIMKYEEERQLFFKFFDVKGFCIMAFMMTFGIGLRVSGLLPDVFIADFYTGLGTSLLTAGVIFIVNFIKEFREIKHSHSAN